MIRRRKYPNYLSSLGIDMGDIEWQSPKISERVQMRLRAQAVAIGKVIADDWMQAAKARLADIGRQIAADALDEQRRVEADAERQEAERAAAETKAIIDRLVERELPALKAEMEQKRKQRRAMGKAVQRERAKLEAAAKKLARLKLARLGKR